MTITAEQLTEYLREFGQAVPAFVVSAIIADLATYSAKLDAAAYTTTTHMLIELYSGALVALGAGGRRIQSQGSPAGSRSFDNSSISLSAISSALSKLDTAGIMKDYVGTGGGTWFEIGRA